jgi:hypothetical protein
VIEIPKNPERESVGYDGPVVFVAGVQELLKRVVWTLRATRRILWLFVQFLPWLDSMQNWSRSTLHLAVALDVAIGPALVRQIRLDATGFEILPLEDRLESQPPEQLEHPLVPGVRDVHPEQFVVHREFIPALPERVPDIAEFLFEVCLLGWLCIGQRERLGTDSRLCTLALSQFVHQLVGE